MMKTKVLYEDQQILVIYKPAGLATQTAQIGAVDVVSELRNYLAVKDRAAAGQLKIIHRLDQPVEGLLVFAKTQEAAGRLSSALQKDALHKQYLAVVCGKPREKEGELVDYLVKEKNMARVVSEAERKSAGAKQALLSYKVLDTLTTQEASDDVSLVEIQILTGRFHQIRLQMSHAGYPLLGDRRYGTEKSGELSETLGVRNVALCAYKICFAHPKTGEMLHFQIIPEGNIFQKFDTAIHSLNK